MAPTPPCSERDTSGRMATPSSAATFESANWLLVRSNDEAMRADNPHHSGCPRESVPRRRQHYNARCEPSTEEKKRICPFGQRRAKNGAMNQRSGTTQRDQMLWAIHSKYYIWVDKVHVSHQQCHQCTGFCVSFFVGTEGTKLSRRPIMLSKFVL